MAGSARYTAILDANVLYPATLRDLLLSLARDGLYHARWSERIQDEWVRSLLARRPDLEAAALRRTCELMAQAVPGSVVQGWQHIEPGLTGLPDADDRHVLAAAICGHADAIVTFNLSDFPAEALAPFGVEAQHPDDFLLNQLDLNPIAALKSIKAMRARWQPATHRAWPGRGDREAATAPGGGAPARGGRVDLMANIISENQIGLALLQRSQHLGSEVERSRGSEPWCHASSPANS